MPASENDLHQRFQSLNIETVNYRHAAVFSVEEAKILRGELPGGHCKNLFLKDKKGALWLMVMLEDTALDMKQLQGKLSAARLSFAKPELMREVLGVEPGSVTPFSVINASAAAVQVVLDQAMMERNPLNYHPLTNTATTAISPDDLLTFLRDCGHTPIIMAL